MRVLVLMLCLVVLAGCGESRTVDGELLQTRGELRYLPNGAEPYTGKATSFYANGQLKIEATFVDGELIK
jgi:antitoxin component YwqK of YwqJK toxin-antitoxin module